MGCFMNYRKLFLLTAISIYLTGCVSSGYNRPYMLTESHYKVKESKAKCHTPLNANH